MPGNLRDALVAEQERSIALRQALDGALYAIDLLTRICEPAERPGWDPTYGLEVMIVKQQAESALRME